MSAELLQEEEFSTMKTGRLIRRIIALLKPYLKSTLLFLALVAVISFQDAFFTFLTKLILDDGVFANDAPRFAILLCVYVGVALVQALLVFLMIAIAGILGERMQYDLKKTMFSRLQQLSFSYFDRTPAGWIMARVTSDTAKITSSVTWGLIDFTWAILTIAVSVVFMLVINPVLGLIVAAVFPLIVLVAVRFQKRIFSRFREVRKLNSRLTAGYSENISGVRVVKALGRESQNLEEFASQTKTMYGHSFQAARVSALFLPVIQLIGSAAFAAIVLYTGITPGAGGISLGGIQAFLSYLAFMLWPIQQLARVWASLQSSLASAERVFSLIDAVPDVKDRSGAKAAGRLNGAISFHDVFFSYDHGKPVLDGFNLEIAPGEVVALVGHTGSGKSTVINLIARFYEPTRGEIRMGGVDYRKYTLHSLQSKIGVVLQTPHLFSGTIRENIRYGKLAATEEEITAAARLAHAHEFVMKTEKGYQTEVGENGSLLSTGQKQLVSLARAVLSGPDILIMDEATSAIDTETEELIRLGEQAIFAGRTCVVIAHRLSTIRNSDRIIVLENGRILETGRHEELIERRGAYYSLYAKSFEREEEPAVG